MGRYFLFFLLFTGMTKFSLVEANESLYSPEVSPKEAWEYLKESPYEELPQYKVTYGSFFTKWGESLLLRDSKRTIQLENHFMEPQRKLLFPNGVCVKGEWSIDKHPYDYSGYFKSGSKGVLIGRVATSLSRTKYKQLRTLAISGKVFPTTNPDEPRALKAANFLLLNDNGGKKRKYLTEVQVTNAAPTTVTFGALPLLKIALAVANAFNKADTRRDIRQLYQIAELDSAPPYSSPKWMKLIATDEFQKLSNKIGAEDFRDEVMQIIDKNKTLEFDILVSTELLKGQPQYHKIGRVIFNDYAASIACDESLHFQHPPYLEEYAAPVVNQKPI